MTLEIARGWQVKVRGRRLRVSASLKSDHLPGVVTLDVAVPGTSENDVEVWIGEVMEEANSDYIRLRILAEMVARTLKNICRLYLRKTLKSVEVDLFHTQCTLIAEFLNIITGSHPESSKVPPCPAVRP
jgi:hypothetical protein